MPRTWGYIIIVVALVIGASALLLPVPESVEVTPVEVPKNEAPQAPGAAAPRAPMRARKAAPAPPPAAAPAPKPPTPAIPMQDTTKTRQLIPPRRPG